MTSSHLRQTVCTHWHLTLACRKQLKTRGIERYCKITKVYLEKNKEKKAMQASSDAKCANNLSGLQKPDTG